MPVESSDIGKVMYGSETYRHHNFLLEYYYSAKQRKS